jgi:hypothetical protein
VEREITPEKLGVGPEPGSIPEPLLAPLPLVLSAQTESRRGPRHARRDPRLERRRAAAAPGRSRAEHVSRRRRGERRAIVASVLAVLALVGCVMAILMLATQPTAARLEDEIGALTRRLAADQGQLATLQAAEHGTSAHGTALSRELSHIAGRLTGLQRTVHGLQSVSTAAVDQAIGLRDCVPQLQRELTGLALQTRSVGGRVTSVGLRNPILLSAPCQALLSGF